MMKVVLMFLVCLAAITAVAQEFSIDGDLHLQGELVFSDSTTQNTAFNEEALFPFNIAFMTGVGHGVPDPAYLYLFILSQDGDFIEYNMHANVWTQRTSPPVSTEDIIFMEGVGHGSGNQEYRYVYILTKTNLFYMYNGPSDSWIQLTSPPVAP